MKRLVWVLVLTIAGVVGLWWWGVFAPDPTDEITSRLKEIARLVSFSSGEATFHHYEKIEKFSVFIADNIQVIVDTPDETHTFTGREELLQAVLATRRYGDSLKVEFVDPVIGLGAGKKSALVDLTLKAKFGGDPDLIAQELKVTMKEINGTWTITHVETVKTLRP